MTRPQENKQAQDGVSTSSVSDRHEGDGETSPKHHSLCWIDPKPCAGGGGTGRCPQLQRACTAMSAVGGVRHTAVPLLWSARGGGDALTGRKTDPGNRRVAVAIVGPFLEHWTVQAAHILDLQKRVLQRLDSRR